MDGVERILAQWRRERPDLDVTPMGLVGRATRFSSYLMREMEETFARHGLNYATFDVLATLRRSGEPYTLSPGKLLGTMMITSGTLTNRVDQLVRADLVERRTNPDDARSSLVSLTKAGKLRIDAAVTDHVATLHRITGILSDKDSEVLIAILTDALSSIEKEVR